MFFKDISLKVTNQDLILGFHPHPHLLPPIKTEGRGGKEKAIKPLRMDFLRHCEPSLFEVVAIS